jgi:signal transduction histidine kinase/DNA-binding response OmpR family regulator/ligand-binding sensor domain-containing protein
MKRIVFSIYLLLLSCISASAYSVRQIADKRYMSNISIASLCQDDAGRMWIGTCDGVNIYDGLKIDMLKPKERSNYIIGNIINCMKYGGNDIYWIQSYYGLNRYDRKSNSLIHFNDFKGEFIIDNDHDGNLFVVKENKGIYYFHSQENKFKRLQVTFNPKEVLSFFIDAENKLHVIMKSYNLCFNIRYNRQSGDIRLVRAISHLHYGTTLAYCFNEKNAIYCVDEKGNFSAFDIRTGINRFIYNLSQEMKVRERISGIIKFHESYFVSFTSNGVIALDPSVKGQYTLSELPVNSGVFCMTKDRFQDIVWIGTDGQGCYIFSKSLFSIKSVVLAPFSIDRPVRALFWDTQRNLWIGTKGNGTMKVEHYTPDKMFSSFKAERFTTANSALNSNAVYCFAKSKRNILWMGGDDGLNYYSYREKKIKKIAVSVGQKSFKYIHGIYETQGNELWMVSVGMGVVKARITGTADNPILTSVRAYTVNNKTAEANNFFVIYPESDNRILFGNQEYGSFCYDSKGDRLVRYPKIDDESLNNVLAICKDGYNHYLLGTNLGLVKYSGNSYRVFNTNDGFRNSTIHAILCYSPGDIWLSTNMGLINFNSLHDSFHLYGLDDGLTVMEYTGAAYRDEQTNILLFGGINGFVSISKGGIVPQQYMPRIHFDGLSIFGEPCNLQDFVTQKKDEETVHLDYDQNFFALSFVSPDFIYGGNCVYYYKLGDKNKKWINNGTNGRIVFTNMAPGNYKLSVKYYNRVYGKTSNVFVFHIHIRHPWYSSAGAWMIYVILFVMTLYLMAFAYLARARRKRQETLDQIEKEHQVNVFESKLRFFTNIAHEFITPLTLIYGPCGRIMNVRGLEKNVLRYVQIIQANAERLNNLIHELIEFRQIESGNRQVKIESVQVSLLIEDLAKSFVEIAQAGDIKFMSKIPDDVKWNTDKGFLSTIAINLISNAMKYTSPGKCVKIELEQTDDHLIFRVANEGSSIKEDDFERIFNRYEILNNFESHNEKNFSRNGLGLSISYNMAKLLNGNLKVENTSEGWVMFSLSLPAAELTPKQLLVNLTTEYIPTIEKQPLIVLPKPTSDESRPTMLVIDDEAEMLWLINDIFETDFNLVFLKNPEKLEQIMNDAYPDIIICDIMMPQINGVDLIKSIKQKEETAHIPIVVVSVRHEVEEQMSALSAGAEMYITKPFNAEYLHVSVLQLMKRNERLKSYFTSPISSFEKKKGKLIHKESKKFIRSVLKVINDNITDKDLSPSFIADKLSISLRSFYRKMNEAGEEDNPAELIRECRLYVANDLLLTTRKTIDEVVFESGFSNKVTFFKAFREKFGCTPKEFRNRHLKEIETSGSDGGK